MAKYILRKDGQEVIVETLKNGMVKINTDAISADDHMSMETFIQTMATKFGGKIEQTGKENVGHHHEGIFHKH